MVFVFFEEVHVLDEGAVGSCDQLSVELVFFGG